MMFKKDDSETSIWISTADLLSGLLVIFLFVAVLMTESQERNRTRAEKVEAALREVTGASNDAKLTLQRNIESQFTPYGMKMYHLSSGEIGHAYFKDGDINFRAGSSEITPGFKRLLNNFLPKYIRAIAKCDQKYIKEIRIEGHTSSEWSSNYVANSNYSYIRNMELSQSRTRAILNYALSMPELAQYHDLIKSKLTANGLSSSQLIIENGVENKEKSRRIEFRVVANDQETLRQIKNAMDNNS